MQFDQWWNLIFTVPFGLGVLLVALSVMGAARQGTADGAGHGAHGAHGGHIGGHGHGGHATSHVSGHVTSHTASHQMSHAHHGSQNHHASHNHHTHQNHQSHNNNHGHQKGHKTNSAERHSNGAPHGLLAVLHLQNIPPLMVLQNFLLFWGIIGWLSNRIVGQGAPNPAQFVFTSLIVALCGGFFCTFVLSATLARFTPVEENYAVHKTDLQGCMGEAVSAVNEQMGSVYVYDATGTLHHLPARIRAEDIPIKRGEPILVVAYHQEGDYYQVKKWTPEAELAYPQGASQDGSAVIPEEEGDTATESVTNTMAGQLEGNGP